MDLRFHVNQMVIFLPSPNPLPIRFAGEGLLVRGEDGQKIVMSESSFNHDDAKGAKKSAKRSRIICERNLAVCL